MEVILGLTKAISATLLLLLLGDGISTIFYHVPEHVFGKFHTIIHHGKNRNFLYYAYLTRNPFVLLDGTLAALPYFVFTPWLWQLSCVGTVIGLVLAELHVIWRHVSIVECQTPELIKSFCNLFWITTPERHTFHHQNAFIAFGDIFTFYDYPAQKWLTILRVIRRKFNQKEIIAQSSLSYLLPNIKAEH